MTPDRRSRSRCRYSRYAARCRPTAVLPVPGAPCTQIDWSRSARTSSSCSGWMVATMSRIGPTRGRSISSSRIRLAVAELLAAGEELVFEAGEFAFDEAESSSYGDALRVAGAGLVEGA